MNNLELSLGLLIPFLGTVTGSAMVFLLKKEISASIQKALLGFAAGVMIAASVWSLIIPAIDMAETNGKVAWIPASIGFLCGVGFLLLLDTIIPHLHMNSDNPEGANVRLSKSSMLFLAVTLHNIPEGMAVGVVFASALNGQTVMTTTSAFALAIGIAIQNFPEGAIISMPLANAKTNEYGNAIFSKKRAFGYGAFSGVVEPISAVITILLTSLISPILPYILCFAAGAMIYVVIEELIPQSQQGKHSNIGTIGASLGFVLMMILDVALG